MSFTTIFFDLDETLYPTSSGLWPAIRERMNLYMQERLGFTKEQIETVREKYFREYGTTLRGLQANHAVNMDDYLAFVHGIALEDYLQPDPGLRAMLEALAVQKIIFTNADAAHARRVVRAMGLDGCFNAILDVHVLEPYCKPMRQAFEIALEFAGESEARKCVLIDDLPRTTRAAREFGFFTVLMRSTLRQGFDKLNLPAQGNAYSVGNDSPSPDANATLARLIDLPQLLDGW
ncbi:MAG: pyrimidine 5'-nucleotidase [Anaerolineales bacterium]|nr:pyrimidine 5'-nucleotidase [Anaerolineales bacterium]